MQKLVCGLLKGGRVGSDHRIKALNLYFHLLGQIDQLSFQQFVNYSPGLM